MARLRWRTPICLGFRRPGGDLEFLRTLLALRNCVLLRRPHLRGFKTDGPRLRRWFPVFAVILLASGGVSGAQSEPRGALANRNPRDLGFLGTLSESLVGDVYEPGR